MNLVRRDGQRYERKDYGGGRFARMAMLRLVATVAEKGGAQAVHCGFFPQLCNPPGGAPHFRGAAGFPQANQEEL
ncbi:MAG: hypothetical protein D6765_09690 [Bacteroidetes bacterium]|nr:MAG: hypothetical protein D6765_09690 [Bacteroidota bacterium]